MELKEFVTGVLVDIVEGIRAAQKGVGSDDAEVSPEMDHRQVASGWKGLNDRHARPVHVVEFDVAVAAAEGSGTKGGIGVVVGIFALGTRAESSAANETVSRVRFSVPLRLPAPKER